MPLLPDRQERIGNLPHSGLQNWVCRNQAHQTFQTQNIQFRATRHKSEAECHQEEEAPESAPIALDVSLLPSNEISEERRKDYKPIALGGMDAYPDRITASIGVRPMPCRRFSRC
jgi:hypothetical protein